MKYRKQHRGHRRGLAIRGSKISFGDYGLAVTQDGWLTSRQIEASRIAISRFVKRGGKIWIRVFPDKAITKKALGVRMGGGKGNPEYWVASVKPGRIVFEMNGVTQEQAQEAFRLAGHKLPIKTRFIERGQIR